MKLCKITLTKQGADIIKSRQAGLYGRVRLSGSQLQAKQIAQQSSYEIIRTMLPKASIEAACQFLRKSPGKFAHHIVTVETID